MFLGTDFRQALPQSTERASKGIPQNKTHQDHQTLSSKISYGPSFYSSELSAKMSKKHPRK